MVKKIHISVRIGLFASLLGLTVGCTTSPGPVATPSVPAPTQAATQPSPTLQPSAISTSQAEPTLATTQVSGGPIVNFEYTPTGSLLIATQNSLELFDPTQKAIQWSASVSEGCCDELAVTSDLVAFVTGRGAGVHVLDLASGEELCALQDPDQHFSTVALSRDGQTLATGEFAQIRLWDARTCQPAAAWQTGDEGFANFPWTQGITNLAFSTDDSALFSANWWTGKVMQWDLSSAQLLSSFDLTNTVLYKFTPDARQILVDFNQYGFELHNPQTGALEVNYDKIIGASGFIDFSGDGKRVVVWGYNTDQGGTAGVWELASNTQVQEFSVGRNQTDWSRAALNFDGSTVVLTNEARQTLVFFEVASGKELRRLDMP